MVSKILYHIFTRQLGCAVGALGIGFIKLNIWLCRLAVKYIICGNMDHLGTGLRGGNT